MTLLSSGGMLGVGTSVPGHLGSHVVSAARCPPASCHVASSPHLQPGSTIAEKLMEI